MNELFYHHVLKNNFETFQKYLTKKDGKNLITCRESLFLKDCISKLQVPLRNFRNSSGGHLHLLQLVAMGAQDVDLTVDPKNTFFKIQRRKHSNLLE